MSLAVKSYWHNTRTRGSVVMYFLDRATPRVMRDVRSDRRQTPPSVLHDGSAMLTDYSAWVAALSLVGRISIRLSPMYIVAGPNAGLMKRHELCREPPRGAREFHAVVRFGRHRV